MTQPMHKDEAMEIAQNAKTLPLDQLLYAYNRFHAQTANTATVPVSEVEPAANGGIVCNFYPAGTADLLHGAMGCVTESAELLDALKKNFYGKRKPYSTMNIKEECGDLFWYLTLVMSSQGITLQDIISDNVVKLANRYIEKFEVS